MSTAQNPNETLAARGGPSPLDLAYEANGQRVTPEQFYAIACDPQRSVAVEACAGAGKTWMLVSRILRALIEQTMEEGAKAGTEGHAESASAPLRPQDVLAITFTKKAAGEMRERLYEWLARFAKASPEQLRSELLLRGVSEEFLNKNAGEPAWNGVSLLSNLYQRLLLNGRQVQIRTFHGWFAALLRNAPLAVLQALDLPARYELLEDDAQAVALMWPRFYSALHREPQALADYQALVHAHGRHQAHKALEALLAKRTEFALADAAGVADASVPALAALFTEFAGLDAPDDMLNANRDHRQKLRDAAAALGAASAKTFVEKGVELEQAVTAHDWPAAIDALFTQKAEPRKFGEKIVGIERVRIAQDLLQRVLQGRSQHAAWLHQQRLLRLGRVLLPEFAALKRERGWVDMPDLERAALHLLSDAQLGAWVQQRLDAQVRHLLIDEFQDTNPMQWQALSAWLASYAGAGGGGRAPGVFIVGDPKQSIYRFRRAEPQVFRAAQAFVADADGLKGTRLACDHTRRNAPEVLAAVNAVMGEAMNGEGFRPHTTASTLHGAVLRLPQIPRPIDSKKSARTEWRDTLTEPRESVEDTLRTLEARQAARWIANEIAQGAKPQDFMVLARRRASLGLMHAELRELHIGAAVAEKLGLMDCCEVQDMVALMDALVSTTHSLSLARALKSPLFGLTDDDLVAIALCVKATEATAWLDALSKPEHLPQHLRWLHADLMQYQAWLGSLPPHDALSAIFHHGNVLRKFAAAAPPAQRASVLANLGALLQATLQVQGARYTTAYSFVRALKSGSVKAPAQTPADAVQLLTVHGAKGLEAPTVILLDTDAQASRSETMGVLVDWPGEAERPRSFVCVASEAQAAPSMQSALQAEQAARSREEINALYVAMTRAQQRLVVSSSEAHRPDTTSWWSRLLPHATPVEVGEQIPGDASVVAEPNFSAQAKPHPSVRTELVEALPASSNTFELTDLPLYTPDAGVNRSSIAIKNVAFGSALARIGSAMHRLLEWQRASTGPPKLQVTPQQLSAVVREFKLTHDELAQAQSIAQRIREGQGSWAWDAALIAWEGNEVELAHEGQLLRIDRLVQRKDTGAWWVLDYKSATNPAHDAEHGEQMQIYLQAVKALHSQASVQGALLGGDGSIRRL